MPPEILEKIIVKKAKELEIARTQVPLHILKERCAQLSPPRHFINAIRTKHNTNQPAIIAEIKQASPSRGVICKDFDPVKIAHGYVNTGAACISVLTDEPFFQGSNDHLIQVRNACDLPILRKDFTIDSYQIYQARSIGADCILLIVSCLSDAQLHDFYALANELNMAVLVESHTEAELQRALQLPTPLIGINNRDLHTFQTDLNTCYRLSPLIPDERIIVAESGIKTRNDIEQMQKHGIQTFLIGEALISGVHNIMPTTTG